MGPYRMSVRAFLLAGSVLAAAPTLGTEVTPNRLVNADREPQNWLMNHRTYDSQRYSPLDKINKGNVKSLKIAYAVAIGGTSANENLEATPLAEDGFLYLTDQWGVLYKIDGRSGDAGRIVWRMDPGRRKSMRRTGAPRCGQFRHQHGELSAAHDRDRQGDRQSRVGDQPLRRPIHSAILRGAARGQG